MKYYQRIRNVREDMDIKQYEFANMIGVLKKTYSLYETGTRDMPLDILDRVLLKLNLSFDYVLGISNNRCYDNIKPMNILSIPDNIKNFRTNLGLSQEEFANRMSINQQTVSNLENGKNITIDNLYLICLTYNISADLLTGKIDNKVNLQLQK